MNNLLDTVLQSRLDDRLNAGLYRELKISGDLVDFSSNDYLGFARLPETAFDAQWPSGATGSRLISGNSTEAEQAETDLAKFYHTEAALIFNCGYMANIGLFSTLAGKGDTWIADAYCHASILDGMRLGYAMRYKFRHNDAADLEKKLKQASGHIFVAVESLYSMDGDFAPLHDITALCRKYHAHLIVDEAHATGIYGEQGRGYVAACGLQDQVYASVHTFGKALGLHGAVVTGSLTLRNYLINHARSFIYSTALPPAAYSQIQHAYTLLPSAKRESLHELVQYFRESILSVDHFTFIDSTSQIQGILLGDKHRAKALSLYLQEAGIYAKAILSPTVPEGTERLRICLHSFNTKSEIDHLFNSLKTFNA